LLDDNDEWWAMARRRPDAVDEVEAVDRRRRLAKHGIAAVQYWATKNLHLNHID
jgi:hypothetical protein